MVSSSRALSNWLESRAQLVDHRAQLADVGPVMGTAEHPLPGAHPVDVAAQGVDLAVVGAHAEGLCQVPAGQDVGGEAGVHKGEAGDHAAVLEIGVEDGQLVGGQHPLVDQGPAAEAGEVEAVPRQADRVAAALDDAAEHVEAPLEEVAVEADGGDERLADDGQPGERRRPQATRLDGDVAPAQQTEPLVVAGGGGERLAVGPRRIVLGKEGHTHRVRARRGQGKRHLAAQEGVGELDEDAGSVAAQRITADGAAVTQVAECLEPRADDPVRALAMKRGHEGDAAAIVVQAWIVEAPHPVRVPQMSGDVGVSCHGGRGVLRRSGCLSGGRDEADPGPGTVLSEATAGFAP